MKKTKNIGRKRLTNSSVPDTSYTYDRLGRQLSTIAAEVSTNLYTYSADTLELIAETQNGVVINRSRDAFGRSDGFTMGQDYGVEYGYDTYARFSGVTAHYPLSTNHFSYSYLPGTPLISGMTASSGYAWTRSYEPNRNLISAVTNLFNGNLISAFDYENDAIGRRTVRLDTLPETIPTLNVFEYNLRSEVIGADMGTNTYGYAFDPIGNRIVSTNNSEVLTYTANELNQYTTISNAVTALPTYDDDGNMLANGVLSYVWDGENRLVGVSSNDVKLVSYSYDHQSRRISKTVYHPLPATHSYTYDGWNLIAETSGTNTTHYIWGLDLSGSLQGAGGVDGLLAVISPLPLGEGGGEGSTAYLPCYDGNGNVTEYVSADGTIAAHYEYSPFGETIIKTGDLAGTFALRFSTKYWEDEAKLYYYGYRFYVPATGRWLNRDPIGNFGGINLYCFASNDTAGNVDVFGLAKLDPPATPEKCDKLARIMAFSSWAAGPVSYFLWTRWLENMGGFEELSMAAFDPLGTCRNRARDEVFQSLQNNLQGLVQGLPCETSTLINKTTVPSQSCASPNLMINEYTLTLTYEGSLTRHCEDCCSMFVMNVTINHRATDTTDFNNGSRFPALPWYDIADELVNQCFNVGRNDFDIYSSWSESSPFFIYTCDGGSSK
jgi:RHS repeat-associated protein